MNTFYIDEYFEVTSMTHITREKLILVFESITVFVMPYRCFHEISYNYIMEFFF